MSKCQHTSAWWKHHSTCFVCGEAYTDEAAKQIARNTYIQSWNPTPEQQAVIARLKQNAEES